MAYPSIYQEIERWHAALFKKAVLLILDKVERVTDEAWLVLSKDEVDLWFKV